MKLLVNLRNSSEKIEDSLIKFYDYYETKDNFYLVFELLENSCDLE